MREPRETIETVAVDYPFTNEHDTGVTYADEVVARNAASWRGERTFIRRTTTTVVREEVVER